MLRVAVLIDNTLQYDRRALLELETLSQLPIDIAVYCNTSDNTQVTEKLHGIQVNRVFDGSFWQHRTRHLLNDFAKKIAKENFDVLHCHDQYMLSIGAAVKKLNPATVLIYESRELFYSYPINFFNNGRLNAIKSQLVRRFQVARERSNLRKVDYVIAVNSSIGKILHDRFKLRQAPVVIRNIGPLRIASANTLLKDELGIHHQKKVIVYIGSNVYPKVLQLEKLIDQIRGSDSYVLVIVATNNVRRDWFKNYILTNDIRNVYFRDMIPVGELELYLAGCDVGLLTAWNKKDLSYWYALDNKLFSYIMAGLPVLSTAQPEYKKIVEQYNVGVCIDPDTPDAFVNGLRCIDERAEEIKRNTERARLELNWENEKSALTNLYDSLIA